MLTQHANKVLSYVPERSRIAAEPKTVSVEQLLHANTSLSDEEPIPSAATPGRHFFKREGLYELVWTAPVSDVARKLGVSDVGLAKLCRRGGYTDSRTWLLGQSRIGATHRRRASAASAGRSAATTQDPRQKSNIKRRGSGQCAFSAALKPRTCLNDCSGRGAGVDSKARTIPRLRAEGHALTQAWGRTVAGSNPVCGIIHGEPLTSTQSQMKVQHISHPNYGGSPQRSTHVMQFETLALEPRFREVGPHPFQALHQAAKAQALLSVCFRMEGRLSSAQRRRFFRSDCLRCDLTARGVALAVEQHHFQRNEQHGQHGK